MKNIATLAAALSALLIGICGNAAQPTLAQQNEQMFQLIQQERGLTPKQMEQVRSLFARSGYMGQGNPAISVHPESEEGCRKKLEQQHVSYANPRFEKICGAKYWRLSMIRKRPLRSRPKPVSTSSNIRMCHVPTRWCG